MTIPQKRSKNLQTNNLKIESYENVENKQTKSKDEVKNASETEKDSKKDKKVEKKVVLIKDEPAVEANFELNQNVQAKSDEQKNQKLSA